MITSNLILPYYAVIFTTIANDDLQGYQDAAIKMEELAKLQDGYLGIDAARSDIGITVSYWKTLAAITAWKNNLEHTKVRDLGREKWYKHYELRVCKVERAYSFKNK